ncbi:MAG: IPT/TIG domain-containing protein [Myxococcota bacterium]
MRYRILRLSIVLICCMFAGACSDPESNNGDNANNQADTGADGEADVGDDADPGDELTVQSIQPASGPVDGGTEVVISGTGFEDVDSVTFGGVDAADFSRISSFEVEATTPAAGQAGPVDVTVTLASGDSASLSEGFSYEESGPQLAIGYCALQFPESTTTTTGTATEDIFGRVFVENCSESDQQCEPVSGELGWGPTDADPTATPDAFAWQPATYNADHTSDNNDEYRAKATANASGDYSYVYRFKVDDSDWTYCDLDGSDNGFDTDQMGALTVEDATEQSVGFCTIQFPESTATAPGVPTEQIYGRAFVQDCTTGDAECTDLEGELGVGAPTDDPSADPAQFDWVSATYNAGHTADDNDEFQASLQLADTGSYGYAYRFRVGTSDWTYCDVDGSDNGFATDQMGALTVETVTVDWCNIQAPESIDATVGDTNTVYGQVYVDGCTDGGNDCQQVLAELGVAPDGSDASADASAYTWRDAERNLGFGDAANDEFQSTLPASTAGDFVYAYRMSGDGGQSWTYCDRDGTDNGFQADQQGTMTVTSP